jgi:hypothetical protein
MKGYSEFKVYRTQMAFDGETRSFVSVKVALPGPFETVSHGDRDEAARTPHLPCGNTCHGTTRPVDVP